jgi:membrane protease YdiL (CAAX protease family)
MKQPDQTMLLPVPPNNALLDAILCSAGFAWFAYLIIYPFPLKTAALIPLSASAYIMSRNINWSLFSRKFLLQKFSPKRMIASNLIGLQMGIIGAMYYRGSFGMPVFPSAIRGFAMTAVCIGILEELLFRGFIQGRLLKLNPGFAILFAAFAHATYKVFLFISPASQHLPSIALFYIWTIGASIVIGLLRYYSKSIVPAIIVHAIFDLLVYAENLQAPWWVW